MMNVITGVSFWIQGGQYISIQAPDFVTMFDGLLGPVPTEIVILLIITAVASFVMRWTLFGRRLYALGGNLEAARLSGLPVNRDHITAYIVSGFLAGLAGLILAAQLREGNDLLGATLALGSIAAAVVGGASLFGGASSPLAAVGGGLVIAMIQNILGLISMPANEQLVVTGALILLAVFFTTGRGVAGKSGIARVLRSRRREVNQ
jgi:ribose transport system permease protein